METFFRTHKYLLEHSGKTVRRNLMDEINWEHKLIGIKGTRGVGKTTFLLDYAKEHFGADNRACLYINLNQFYFTTHSLIEFAKAFAVRGGKVLIIDQVFKYPNWSEELRYCYDNIPELKIIFTGSSVMRLKQENPYLSGCVDVYNLKGFSFREFLNIQTGSNLQTYSLDDIINYHEEIACEICKNVHPLNYFGDYMHHGFYPFFLENKNFSENLLKVMNMMLEVDILFIQQIEQTYLHKLRKLLYLLADVAPVAPNVSQLSKEIETSRATVMNYIKYLTDARLLNMLYPIGESFPKKPSKVYLSNSNLAYAVNPLLVNNQSYHDTFFYNQLAKDHKVNDGKNEATFIIDEQHRFTITGKRYLSQHRDTYYAVDSMEIGQKKAIPLWLFGFLY